MKWVTRDHVHVDRVACPWLIRRFIDSKAVFKFVTWPGHTLTSEDGTPFDFPNIEIPFTHHDGKCTFEVLIDHYEIQDPVLQDMARIIHGADVSKDMDESPESHGAELIMSGLAYVSDDDHQAIARGFVVCDSLYAGLLLRRLHKELKDKIENMGRQEKFQLLFTELRKRLPETIKVGHMT
ncbi:MAG: chromate resistance protein ChrB domain-containing protein [Promethearchaeota archaeon]